MKCQEFIDDMYNTYFFDKLCDEVYWNDSNVTSTMWKALLKKAFEMGVILEDADEFNYDDVLYDLYQNTEKGLS